MSNLAIAIQQVSATGPSLMQRYQRLADTKGPLTTCLDVYAAWHAWLENAGGIDQFDKIAEVIREHS